MLDTLRAASDGPGRAVRLALRPHSRARPGHLVGAHERRYGEGETPQKSARGYELIGVNLYNFPVGQQVLIKCKGLLFHFWVDVGVDRNEKRFVDHHYVAIRTPEFALLRGHGDSVNLHAPPSETDQVAQYKKYTSTSLSV